MSAVRRVSSDLDIPARPRIFDATAAVESTPSKPFAFLRLARPQQWFKNIFLVAPLLMSPDIISLGTFAQLCMGIFVFSFLSSSVYVINDLFDRNADRIHPVKKNRPIASGSIRPIEGVLFAIALLCLALPTAFILDLKVGAICCGYLALNLAYTLYLKQQSIVDVLLVASFYVIRVYMGSWLVGIEPTVWLINFTGLLALFIAFAKRRDDVCRALTISHRHSLAGYNQEFLNSAIAIVLGALVALYCVYIASPEVIERYDTNRLNWTIPFVLAGVLRYLQATIVEEQSGEPTQFVLKDRFLLACAVGWTTTFLAVIYHIA